uniref:Uncharacterized protein n=1 Tax=Anguilla anguilla TaxID=7936 RepID=A0A0E9XI26_ANGAN
MKFNITTCSGLNLTLLFIGLTILEHPLVGVPVIESVAVYFLWNRKQEVLFCYCYSAPLLLSPFMLLSKFVRGNVCEYLRS